MYKLSILFCCILFCATSISAQKIRFSDSSNRWKLVGLSCGGDDNLPVLSYVGYTGDTVINSMYYKVYMDQAFIREDTIAQKVYAISNTWPDYDTTERLLYDYNLQVGDTFTSIHAIHVVDSIDTVTISNLVYKIWHLRSLTQFAPDSNGMMVDYDVVEGIGCLNEPLYPLYPYFFEGCVFVCCFENKGVNPPFSRPLDTFSWDYYPYGWWGVIPFDNATSCNEDFNLAVAKLNGTTNTVSIAPDPITAYSKISFSSPIFSGELVITNYMGQMIYSTALTGQSEIRIGDKISLPGLYMYKIFDRQHSASFAGKFVK